ncbi:L,D-transpeptidase [Tepidamorphus sp. 3E244]|uniref:L,D-transpeptidase n=1 Tax=Tepidamorphus sp. 3E244 TaxID=3385498 RepID=UPI0038FCDC81
MKRFLLALLGLVTAAVVAVPSTSYANIDPMTGQAYGSGSGGYSPVRSKVVPFDTKYSKGTIIVKTSEKRLYLVLGDGKAMRYGVGVGRPGFQWHGSHRISRKAEWPGWTPPAAMRKRVPNLPAYMPGGPGNPLGARAMYIGSTLYRIHGSNEPWTIGREVSSGCIRMTNPDVKDLYNRVRVGARVIVTR